MTSTHPFTWWQEHQAFAPADAADPHDEIPPFSVELLDLLADVEDAFAETGADTPGWDDPHLRADGERRASSDAEYSRCQEPGKYRILWARAEAWIRVLTARGWADAVEVEDGAQVSWAGKAFTDRYRTTVLSPRRPGAQPLVLARTAPDDAVGSTDLTGDDAVSLDLVVGLGEPAVAVLEPDCLCDACDSGSRDLLGELDHAILSVVDGSVEIVRSSHGHSRRTSFGAESGSGVDEPDVSVQIAAGPWAKDWASRLLCPPVDATASAWTEEMLRKSRRKRLLDALVGALPPPFVARIRSLRAGHQGMVTSVGYTTRVQQKITAPVDALENPPAGYRRIHRSAVVTGVSFEDAAADVLTWALQCRAGIDVVASSTPLTEGTEARLRLGVGPFTITAPCRVLQVIDEPGRQGFRYATLPGHPESGIEQFLVTRTATGLVRVHLDAVSRPATWYARLGAPVTRVVQEIATRRYLRALSTSTDR
ncbi:MAG: DUF1990 domain-containing protein [Brachybacterium sp.]|uniref:DUF1990 domain-containing protein n=1 Tax=Brachybacterium sp. TaxID=1891286 RepID=UPI00264877A7|nr:DUF1990 domain-containing protein [Brachybacterium sp.]MDN5685583.1 DUF1990 domain-containing protein [Brachybacterium sp.]